MDYQSSQELEAIKRELHSIISELEDIRNHVRTDFTGIGSGDCADSISSVLNNLYTAERRLNNLDRNSVMQWFINAHPEIYGGGGSGGGGGSSRRF